MRRFVVVVSLALIAASMAGCAKRTAVSTGQLVDTTAGVDGPVPVPGVITAQAAIGFVPQGPYLLDVGDRLRVVVFGQEGLTNSYAVDSTGNISMPLIGAVPASGRSTRALEQEIAGRLRGGFFRDPSVSVEVDIYRPFFIMGEVLTAGQFPYVNGMTVQTAVAIAGGFSPRANRWSFEVTRRVNGQTLRAEVPATHPVVPGDTIVVKERWF